MLEQFVVAQTLTRLPDFPEVTLMLGFIEIDIDFVQYERVGVIVFELGVCPVFNGSLQVANGLSLLDVDGDETLAVGDNAVKVVFRHLEGG